MSVRPRSWSLLFWLLRRGDAGGGRLPARGELRPGARPRELLLGLGEPGTVLRLAHDADRDRHEGVVHPAQLAALAVVDAFAIGLEPDLVEAARNGVHS